MPLEAEAAGADSVAEMLRRRQRHTPAPGSTCANCETELKGPYCHSCGQGSDNHKRSILKLLWESVKDLLSWDGRFLRTAPLLFFRPGKLARDYMEGRVSRHVPPFRTFLIALVAFILSAEHMVDRVRHDAEVRQQQRIISLGTPQGRSKEADALRAAARAERKGEITEAKADRVEAMVKKGADTAGVEAEYQADIAGAEKDYLEEMAKADRIQRGEEQPASFGADFKFDLPKERGGTGVDKDALWVEDGFRNAVANPDYYFVVLFTWGQRLAILLLPILALSLSAAYLTKRKYYLFDHLLVAMNLLSFGFLTNALGFWLPSAIFGWWLGLLTLWTPFNLFQTLRGAYGSSVFGAIVKSLFIWTVNGLAFFALVVGVVLYSFRQMS